MDQQEKQGQLAGELTGQQPETPADNKKKKEKRPLGLEILSWILTILVAVAATLVIRTVIFEPVRVDGASMNDTLADGEIMFVTKFD
ncbi:MAG: S26 family signal peptidase [Clostridia bacterium]|nr:S26 family signal peptidase [Clostridia bacterium]